MKSLLIAGVVALMLVGCGSDESGSEEPCDTTEAKGAVCEAGIAQECPCIDGTTGVQVCSDSGAKWGACECAADQEPVVTVVKVQDICVKYDAEPTNLGVCYPEESLWLSCSLKPGQVVVGCVEQPSTPKGYCCRP